MILKLYSVLGMQLSYTEISDFIMLLNNVKILVEFLYNTYILYRNLLPKTNGFLN
jgi:hypothetical protein